MNVQYEFLYLMLTRPKINSVETPFTTSYPLIGPYSMILASNWTEPDHPSRMYAVSLEVPLDHPIDSTRYGFSLENLKKTKCGVV
jgi:hypothetical protein